MNFFRTQQDIHHQQQQDTSELSKEQQELKYIINRQLAHTKICKHCMDQLCDYLNDFKNTEKDGMVNK